MIKADKYFKSNLEKVVFEGSIDQNARPKYKDGSEANSEYVTQIFEEYDIDSGEFPITTLRNTAIKKGIEEIFTIYQDQEHTIEAFEKRGVKWWKPWADKDGNLGQRYGATVSRYDLVNNLLNGLEKDPFGRRHIINLFQYSDFKETEGLIPCAYETLWSVREFDNRMFLDMTLVQRSSDYIMAGYINKIQYVALQMMIAHHLNFKIGKFCHFVQNLHIYDRHESAAFEILNKKTLDFQPSIELTAEKGKKFYDFKSSDFKINVGEGITKLNSNLEIAI